METKLNFHAVLDAKDYNSALAHIAGAVNSHDYIEVEKCSEIWLRRNGPKPGLLYFNYGSVVQAVESPCEKFLGIFHSALRERLIYNAHKSRDII